MDGSISPQLQQVLDRLGTMVVDTVGRRKGACDDLQQLCSLVLHSNRDKVLALLEQTEEEVECILMKLKWISSKKDSLEHRKHKDLTFLIELACTLAIALGASTTQSPT